MLADKRLIVTGVVNTDSIAYAVAERAQLMGAELLLTAFPRDRQLTETAAAQLPRRPEVVDLDATEPAHFDALIEHLRGSWGYLDGALHAIAFAPRDALAGDFLAARPEGVNLAFQTSAFSYASLARVLAELVPERGGALVGLDFDATGAWPVYNWMGVCKAALESVNRYLARDLGSGAIRANLIAAGPLETRAASGIPDFQRLLEAWEQRAPIAWDPRDPGPVADAACFLLSDLARAITGEIVHVDGGYHAMAGALHTTARSANLGREAGGVRAPAGRAGPMPSVRDRLLLVFADLSSYGIAAEPAIAAEPDAARAALRRAILARFPHALGSYVFWTAADDACFDPQGNLRESLTLYCSAREVARAAQAALGRVGMEAREITGPHRLLIEPTSAASSVIDTRTSERA